MKFSRFLLLLVLTTSTSAYADNDDTWKAVEQSYLEAADEPGAVLFTPPEGWLVADPKMLPSTVKAMVVGKGKNHFPPSMNLGVEAFDGELKAYLKKVKEINHAHGTEWQDLGKIRTEAGNASLSQVDMLSEWGEVRLMHAILVRKGYAYILTASALKEEFPTFYKDFFSSLRSLHFNPDLYEAIDSPARQKQLTQECKELEKQWSDFLAKSPEKERHSLFSSPEFQGTIWASFREKILEEYNDLGNDWLSLFFKKMEKDLLSKTS